MDNKEQPILPELSLEQIKEVQLKLLNLQGKLLKGETLSDNERQAVKNLLGLTVKAEERPAIEEATAQRTSTVAEAVKQVVTKPAAAPVSTSLIPENPTTAQDLPVSSIPKNPEEPEETEETEETEKPEEPEEKIEEKIEENPDINTLLDMKLSEQEFGSKLRRIKDKEFLSELSKKLLERLTFSGIDKGFTFEYLSRTIDDIFHVKDEENFDYYYKKIINGKSELKHSWENPNNLIRSEISFDKIDWSVGVDSEKFKRKMAEEAESLKGTIVGDFLRPDKDFETARDSLLSLDDAALQSKLLKINEEVNAWFDSKIEEAGGSDKEKKFLKERSVDFKFGFEHSRELELLVKKGPGQDSEFWHFKIGLLLNKIRFLTSINEDRFETISNQIKLTKLWNETYDEIAEEVQKDPEFLKTNRVAEKYSKKFWEYLQKRLPDGSDLKYEYVFGKIALPKARRSLVIFNPFCGSGAGGKFRQAFNLDKMGEIPMPQHFRLISPMVLQNTTDSIAEINQGRARIASTGKAELWEKGLGAKLRQ